MNECRLRLDLGHSRFDVLLEDDQARTAYTDRTGTTRTSECPAATLLAFAEQITRSLSPKQQAA